MNKISPEMQNTIISEYPDREDLHELVKRGDAILDIYSIVVEEHMKQMELIKAIPSVSDKTKQFSTHMDKYNSLLEYLTGLLDDEDE